MDIFLGVYSSRAPGAGAKSASGRRKRYWFAWDGGEDGYRVQELDPAFQPQGEILAVDATAFQAGFSPEPAMLAAPVVQRTRPQAGAVRQEEAPAQRAAALEEVESHLRAHFAALLVRAKRGDDLPNALRALQEIAEIEEGIVPEHKHMFAEFGVNLRKGQFPEEALAHARRVLSLSPEDSHAHFNLARIYHALGKLSEAEQHLLAALEFAPDFEFARDFLDWIARERRRMEFAASRDKRR